MRTAAAKILRLAVIAAWPVFCGLDAAAQEQAPARRLAGYEAAVSSGDPAAAAAYLADGEAMALAAADAQKAAALLAKAEALKDIKDLLALPWDNARANKLNQALAIRIDVDKPLSKMGAGPEPEKLLRWLEKYQPAYPEAKKAVLKKAIRQWDIVFGTMTSTLDMDWGQANLLNGKNVSITKTSWEGMALRERNAVIYQLMKTEPELREYSDEGRTSARDRAALFASVDKVKASGALSPAQLARLSGKSLEDQAYLLGSFYDGGKNKGDPDLSRIHAARDSLPKEVLPAQQRDLLGGMLNTAVAKELAGTQAGGKVLDFYAKEGPLRIAVRPCGGFYSGYDAAGRSIVLDSETIQQYMRMRGYTADSLMKDRARVAEIAKYMAPAAVYAAAHQMRSSWAANVGVYAPRVQEDEIAAMSLEGLYISEKMRQDPVFKEALLAGRDFSSYAAKKLEVGAEYEMSGSRKFAAAVRQRYFPGLPSLAAAAAQALGAVTEELRRRSALSSREKARLADRGLTQAEAMAMTPEELAGSAGEIRTGALVKIQLDLSDLRGYRSHYAAFASENRKALKILKTGPEQKDPAPPAL